MVLGFLNGDLGILELSETFIVLISKFKNLKESEYQLISLCNVVYKLISKTLMGQSA